MLHSSMISRQESLWIIQAKPQNTSHVPGTSMNTKQSLRGDLKMIRIHFIYIFMFVNDRFITKIRKLQSSSYRCIAFSTQYTSYVRWHGLVDVDAIDWVCVLSWIMSSGKTNTAWSFLLSTLYFPFWLWAAPSPRGCRVVDLVAYYIAGFHGKAFYSFPTIWDCCIAGLSASLTFW